MEKEWDYKGYTCLTWLTDDGNIKFHATREREENTDRESGMLITPDTEKTESKVDSGVDELESRIDEEEQDDMCTC